MIPDRFINLKCAKDLVQTKIRMNFERNAAQPMDSIDLNNAVSHYYEECQEHHSQVLQIFPQFVQTYDSADARALNENCLRALQVRFGADTPRRPLRILISGPAGSGKTT